MRVVLVEPEYAGNIGRIARIMKNFGAEELYLVNPRADHLSVEARRYAMRAQDILENAVVVEDLSRALKGTRIGTTAVTGRYRNLFSPELLSRNFSIKSNISLVFGRESSGLTREELGMMDFLVRIPTRKEYRALPLPVAVGILLYELSRGRRRSEADYSVLLSFFRSMAYRSGARNPAKIVKTFESILKRANATQREVGALIKVFSAYGEYGGHNTEDEPAPRVGGRPPVEGSE